MESSSQTPLSPSPATSGPVCGACAAPAPDAYYSASGDMLCRVCYFAEETRAQNARAEQSLAADAPLGFTPAQAGEETRASSVRTGWIALALCVGITLGTVVLLNRLFLWSGLVAIFGLRAFARALKLPRLDGRQGNVGVGIGIALTLIVLFGIVVLAVFGA
jgi:hypothetical protein